MHMLSKKNIYIPGQAGFACVSDECENAIVLIFTSSSFVQPLALTSFNSASFQDDSSGARSQPFGNRDPKRSKFSYSIAHRD